MKNFPTGGAALVKVTRGRACPSVSVTRSPNDRISLNAWLNGTRSTCHYSDSDGRKVVLFLDIEDLS